MSKEPEELKEDKGGRKEERQVDLGEGSILRYPTLPRAQEPLPVPRGQGGLAHRGLHLPSIMGLMGAQAEMVSHVPFLWQARAPGVRGKGGHGAIVLTLGTVKT